MTPAQREQAIELVNNVGLSNMLDFMADAMDVEAESYYEFVSTYDVGDKLQTYARVVRTIRDEVFRQIGQFDTCIM